MVKLGLDLVVLLEGELLDLTTGMSDERGSSGVDFVLGLRGYEILILVNGRTREMRSTTFTGDLSRARGSLPTSRSGSSNERELDDSRSHYRLCSLFCLRNNKE